MSVCIRHLHTAQNGSACEYWCPRLSLVPPFPLRIRDGDGKTKFGVSFMPLGRLLPGLLGRRAQSHGELKVLNCGADPGPEFWDAVCLPLQSGHGAESSITRALVHHGLAQVKTNIFSLMV